MTITKAFADYSANDPSGTGDTSDSFDSTGFTHVVVFFKHEGAAAVQTPSDNKGSTGWASGTVVDHSNGDIHSQIHYAKIGTPGTGHIVTITLGAARAFRRMGCWLINATSGVIALAHATPANAQAVNQGNGLAIDAGTLTTDAAAVLFMGVGEYTSSNFVQGLGWTLDWNPFNSDGTYSGGQSRAEAAGGTFDPSMTQSGSAEWTANSIAFKEVVGGTSILRQMMQHEA